MITKPIFEIQATNFFFQNWREKFRHKGWGKMKQV